MNDGRRRRQAKQARRDARRQVRRERQVLQPTLADVVRKILADGPLALLQAMGIAVEKGTPEVFSRFRLGESTPMNLSILIDNVAVTPDIEHTMVLALLAELLVDKPALQRRCRLQVEFRGGQLPGLDQGPPAHASGSRCSNRARARRP
ncbi:hypothetical protein [Mycolicibacterium cosmeticum]|uniref:hypothetical protein n=1 Tax=Mycolicibacterium cosmeticum TaxID=258533 RepID=UPI00103E4B9E|nr:hypothetical protein [Mycolicibacterium cosmeticum]